MRLITAAMFSVALGAPLSAQAKADSEISLSKTTKWEMNYDEDSCHLLAKFGEGDDSMILNITRFEPGSSFDVMLFGKMFGTDRTWVPVKIGFGDSPIDQRLGGAGLTASKQPFVLFMNLRLDGRVVDPRDPKILPVSRQMEAHAATATIASRAKYTGSRLARWLHPSTPCVPAPIRCLLLGVMIRPFRQLYPDRPRPSVHRRIG